MESTKSELPVDDPGVGLHFAVFGLRLAGAVTGHRSACSRVAGCFGTAVSAHILDTLVSISRHLVFPLLQHLRRVPPDHLRGGCLLRG